MPPSRRAPPRAAKRRLPVHPEVEAYLERLKGPVSAVARRLVALVRSEVPAAQEDIHYGVPFFFLDVPFCYVSAARSHVTLGFPDGAELRDSSGRLTGTGKSSVRKTVYRSVAEIDEEEVRGWVAQAAAVAALRARGTSR